MNVRRACDQVAAPRIHWSTSHSDEVQREVGRSFDGPALEIAILSAATS